MRNKLLLAAALLAAACGPEKPSAVKTSSTPNQPAWMTRATNSPDALFFTGAKEGAGSLDEGKDSALESARSQAAQYIGVEISAEHSDVMSTEEAENKAKDTVKSRATAMVRSAELADVYWEKISREAGSGTIDRYDVWVLIKLPRAEIVQERDRQKAEAKQTASSALARYREGLDQEKSGDELAALVRFRDALGKMKGLGQSIETGDAQVASAGQLQQLLQDAAAKAQSRVRRALVIAPDWVAGAVTQALSKQGFSAQTQSSMDEDGALKQARSQGTPWVIVVHATTTPGGHVFAQVAATAALDVRALDARSGAVVASAQKQAKGVGRTPEAAQQAAASEAGLGAGNDLAAALVAKEIRDSKTFSRRRSGNTGGVNVKKIIGMAIATAALVACGGGNKPEMSNQVLHANGPDWVNRGSGAFGGDKGKVFYGVGIASGIRNAAMRRSTSDSRGRAEISKILDTYVSVLNKDYMASTTAGDMSASSEEQHVEQALKTYSQMELSGVQIIDHWVDTDGTEYALAALDMDAFKNNMDKMKELNDKVKEQVKANADKAFDELNAEEAKHQK